MLVSPFERTRSRKAEVANRALDATRGLVRRPVAFEPNSARMDKDLEN